MESLDILNLIYDAIRYHDPNDVDVSKDIGIDGQPQLVIKVKNDNGKEQAFILDEQSLIQA